MIPILYEKDESTFTSEGLGRLTDALSCKVMHSFSGMYELEMDYPVNGIHYEDLIVDRIILAKPEVEKQPQPMRIYQISSPDLETITVYARHWCYQLNYLPVRPFSAVNVTEAMQKLKTNSIENCPFTFSCTFTTSDTNSETTTENVGNRFTLDGLTANTTYYLYLYAVNFYGVKQSATITTSTTTSTNSHTVSTGNTSDAAPIINDFFVASTTTNSITIGFDVSGAMPMKLYLGYWTSSTYATQISVPMTSTGTVTVPENAFSFEEPKMIRLVLSGEEDSIVAKWGGEVDWDMDQVILKERIGSDNGVFIRYAKNLTGLTQELNSESCYSGAFGYYYKKGTDVDAATTAEETSETKDKTVLVMANQVYDFETETSNHMKRVYLVDLTSYFDDLYKDEKDSDGNTRVPTAQEVYDATVSYAQENGLRNISVSIDVDFLDLSKTTEFEGKENLETVSFGDTIYVQYPNMNVNIQARVSETDYDVLRERYNKITIGEVMSGVADATLSLFGNYYNAVGYGKRESVLMDGLGNFSSIRQTAEQISSMVSKGDAIMSQKIYYLATSADSGVTVNTSGWTDYPQTMDATNKYLWTYVLYTYADNHTTTSAPVITGVYGDSGDGLGILEVVPLYRSYIYDGTTYSPPKPTAEITNTGKVANTWTKALPLMSSTYKYLFTCNQIKYTDGTFGWTDVVRNEGMESLVASATYTEILQSSDYIQMIAQNGASGLASIINQTASAITLDANYINLQGLTQIYNSSGSYAGRIGSGSTSDGLQSAGIVLYRESSYNSSLVNYVGVSASNAGLYSGNASVILQGSGVVSGATSSTLYIGRSSYPVNTSARGNIYPASNQTYSLGQLNYGWNQIFVYCVDSTDYNTDILFRRWTSSSAYYGVKLNAGTFRAIAPSESSYAQTTKLGSDTYPWSYIYSSNALVVTSDRHKKQNIDYDIDKYVAILEELKPCSFEIIDDTSGKTHLGMIAQDVEDTLHDAGIDTNDFAALNIGRAYYDENGEELYGDDAPDRAARTEDHYGLLYEEFIPLLIAQNQKQQAEINELKAEIAQIKAALNL